VVRRGALREVLSRVYRRWQQVVLGLPVADAQCGFKVVSRRVALEIVPGLRERRWLFDSELLAHCARRGWTVREVPVEWIEHRAPGRRSAIRLWKDGWEFIFGAWRIRRRLKKISTPPC
jgi:dolichyl-phosphate beta-glucosyltransferase